MGWSFRKSFKVGPLRVNLSKSGIGVSAGVRGARIGVNARGRTYGSVGIPGTGLHYRATLTTAQRQNADDNSPPQPQQNDGLVRGIGRVIKLLVLIPVCVLGVFIALGFVLTYFAAPSTSTTPHTSKEPAAIRVPVATKQIIQKPSTIFDADHKQPSLPARGGKSDLPTVVRPITNEAPSSSVSQAALSHITTSLRTERDWQLVDGSKLRGTLKSLGAGVVRIIKPDGTEVKVNASALSPEDMRFISSNLH